MASPPYKFGQESQDALSTVHPFLRHILSIAIQFVDFKVLEGHRDEERQNALYQDRKTQVQWPESWHNAVPSMAADVAPYPIDWEDTDRFYYTMGVIMGVGNEWLTHNNLDHIFYLRYGGDWDRDGNVSNERFKDLGHIELRRYHND